MRPRTLWALLVVGVFGVGGVQLCFGQTAAGTAGSGPTGYAVERTVFLPPTYNVGDRVEVRITVRVAGSLAPTVPPELPQPAWGDITAIQVVDRSTPNAAEYEIRIGFRAFNTGTRSLPAIDLGAFTLQPINVFVTAVLTEDDTLNPIREQMLVPGTRSIVVLVIVIAVAGPLGWLVFARWGRSRVAAVIGRYRDGLPYRRFTKNIKGLSALAAELDGKDFYIALLTEIRRYLSARAGTDFVSATTMEVAAHLRGVRFRAMTDDDRAQLVDVFVFGDLVKFAYRPAPLARRMEHVTQAQDVCGRLEQASRRPPGGNDVDV